MYIILNNMELVTIMLPQLQMIPVTCSATYYMLI